MRRKIFVVSIVVLTFMGVFVWQQSASSRQLARKVPQRAVAGAGGHGFEAVASPCPDGWYPPILYPSMWKWEERGGARPNTAQWDPDIAFPSEWDTRRMDWNPARWNIPSGWSWDYTGGWYPVGWRWCPESR